MHRSCATPGYDGRNRQLQFNYTVTDGDGDTVTGILRVNVNDDTPVTTASITASPVLDDEVHDLDASGGAFYPNNTPVMALANVSTPFGCGGSAVPGWRGWRSLCRDCDAGQLCRLSGTTRRCCQDRGSDVGHLRQGAWRGAMIWTATSGHHAPAAVLTINADGSYSRAECAGCA